MKGPKLWAQVLERGGMFRHQIRPRAPEVQNVFNKKHLNNGGFLVQVELRLRLGQYSKPYLSKPPIGRIPFVDWETYAHPAQITDFMLKLRARSHSSRGSGESKGFKEMPSLRLSLIMKVGGFLH